MDTLIITITFKISLRYLGLHAAFTALLVHTALTRLVDTNGVHTPHYGDYTSKVQHIALLRYVLEPLHFLCDIVRNSLPLFWRFPVGILQRIWFLAVADWVFFPWAPRRHDRCCPHGSFLAQKLRSTAEES